MVDEIIEITLFLVPMDGAFEFFGVKEFCKYLFIVGSVGLFYLFHGSLSPWAKEMQHSL